MENTNSKKLNNITLNSIKKLLEDIKSDDNFLNQNIRNIAELARLRYIYLAKIESSTNNKNEKLELSLEQLEKLLKKIY